MSICDTLLFEDIDNFRDFGGCASRHGRVKRGRLLRSGALDRASGADLEILDGYRVEVVIDLRGTAERQASPSRRSPGFAGKVIEMIETEGHQAPHLGLLDAGPLSAATLRSAMTALYRRIPFDPAHRAHFSESFDAMARADAAVLVHCAAGKDRTGIFVSLVLGLLGANRDDIFEDYSRSAAEPRLRERLRERIARLAELKGREIGPEGIDVLISVDPAYLEAAWDEIESRCGSLDHYLALVGVGADTADAIRRRFIE